MYIYPLTISITIYICGDTKYDRYQYIIIYEQCHLNGYKYYYTYTYHITYFIIYLSTSAIPWDLQLEAEQNSMHGRISRSAAPYGPQSRTSELYKKKRLRMRSMDEERNFYHGNLVNYISYVCFLHFFPINYKL